MSLLSIPLLRGQVTSIAIVSALLHQVGVLVGHLWLASAYWKAALAFQLVGQLEERVNDLHFFIQSTCGRPHQCLVLTAQLCSIHKMSKVKPRSHLVRLALVVLMPIYRCPIYIGLQRLIRISREPHEFLPLLVHLLVLEEPDDRRFLHLCLDQVHSILAGDVRHRQMIHDLARPLLQLLHQSSCPHIQR